MAAKRPAKLAIGKKQQAAKIDPVSGKAMTCIKVLRKSGSSGMKWVLLEEFDGSEKAVSRMLPVR